MSRPGLPRLSLALLALSLSASAHLSKAAAIDGFCLAVRRAFVETQPRYFSGPNPWVELDTLPDEYPDAAIASVYSEGSRVAWVVLEMAGPGDAWFETTNYFFDDTGAIRKRERHFEQPDANVRIQEDTYFEKGKVMKTRYHHSPLGRGKENWDTMYDPNAPEYSSTADLPVLFLDGDSRQLAAAFPPSNPFGKSKCASGLRTVRTSPTM